VTFKYDPFGRRIQKSSSSATTNYLYDGSNSVAEVNVAGSLLVGYTQSAGVDEPLAEVRSGTIGFYDQDGLGSVTSIAANTGTLLNSDIYDAFGNITTSTGSFANPFQYSGRDYDAETGLRYYRARYYDPITGRFLSEDPIGFAGSGPNFYAYVRNNPIRFRDPSGMNPFDGTWPSPWPWMGGGILEVICWGSGTCETVVVVGGVVVGVAAVGYLGYLAYDYVKGKPKATPKPSPRGTKCNNDKHCEEIYAADLAVCSAIPDKQQKAVCSRTATTRYSECLAYGEPRSPLSWWQ
jgi:RHS repeat-associated protein